MLIRNFETYQLRPFQAEFYGKLLKGEVDEAAFLVHRYLGKSYLIRLVAMTAALLLASYKDYSEVLILGPAENHLWTIHWERFKSEYKFFADDEILSWNDSRHELTIQLNWRRCRIIFRGAAKGEKINMRGAHPDYIIFDEFDETNPQLLSEGAIAASLSRRAPIIMFGTPKRRKKNEPPPSVEEREGMLRGRAEDLMKKHKAGNKNVYGIVLNIQESGMDKIPWIAERIKKMRVKDYLVEMELREDVVDDYTYLGSVLPEMRIRGNFANVSYDPNYPTFLVMDIGYSDYGVIYAFQVKSSVELIDCEYARGQPMKNTMNRLKIRIPTALCGFMPVDVKKTEPIEGDFPTYQRCKKALKEVFDADMYRLRKVKNKEDAIKDLREELFNYKINEQRCARPLKELEAYGPVEGRQTPPRNDFVDTFIYMKMAVKKIYNNFEEYQTEYQIRKNQNILRRIGGTQMQNMHGWDIFDEDTGYDFEERIEF